MSGVWMELGPVLDEEVALWERRGGHTGPVHAIRAYRRRMGCSLPTAKRVVEHAVQARREGPAPLDEVVARFVQAAL